MKKVTVVFAWVWFLCLVSNSSAFVITETDLISPGQTVRWDAAPRTNTSGNERSLNGGLRYSVQGGSFLNLHGAFDWKSPAPSVASFQSAVEDAFAAWTVTDPASGLGTTLSFVSDLATTATQGDNQYRRGD